MALQTPNLDDRKFQDLVSEARSKIPQYCPKWTDYNLSDPGVTLIELFAWMVDVLLYRLNRVPEKNYIKFMDLMGIKLEPPKPATVNLTFRLSAGQPETFTIPRGTEVSTMPTETQDAITFATIDDFHILVPDIVYAMTTHDDTEFNDIIPELKNPDRQTSVFQDVPQENDAMYLGFLEDLRAHVLALNVHCSVGGIGVDPNNPPWAWEYWSGERERWLPLVLESDLTGGFNTNGRIVLRIPPSSAQSEVDGKNASWIRCRAVQPAPKQSAYGSSPKITSINAENLGGTVPSSHALRINNEPLGWSNGNPGQKFHLQNFPVLLREEGETLEVETENEGEYEEWQEVGDFAASGPTDLHFTCDSVTGEIQLGPSVRDPSGGESQYGMVPPDGRRVRFKSYRHGGGSIGNVGEGTINVMRSAIAYVDSVTNYEPAKGGTDAETLEGAQLRVPRILRANTRAVTAEDYEYLAREAAPEVARAKCAAPGDGAGEKSPLPGVVRLMLVPAVPDVTSYIPIEDLEVPRRVLEKVEGYLDERRLLATRVEIVTPEYLPVAVVVQVRAKKRCVHEQVAEDVEKRLYEYINPVSGGADGEGWPFGRSLSLPEIYAALQGIPKVDYIEEVSIFPIDPDTGERQEATSKLTISPYSLICSHKHEVTIVE